MELFDAHAHLTDEKFSADLENVIENFKETGVKNVISAGCDVLSSEKAIILANKNSGIYATVGIHPENVPFESFDFNFARAQFDIELKKIEKLAKEKKVVAIGEIGLDYHFIDWLDSQKKLKTGENLSETERNFLREIQKYAFEQQAILAIKLDKAIVVHCRDAMADTLNILQKYTFRSSLLHCYSGSLESAKILMKMGFSFSFGGVATFKNAKNVQEVIKELPLERILLETDCPYMSPEPFRGTRNEPKNIIYVADAIARIKNISIEEVADTTTSNSKKLFNIERG